MILRTSQEHACHDQGATAEWCLRFWWPLSPPARLVLGVAVRLEFAGSTLVCSWFMLRVVSVIQLSLNTESGHETSAMLC